MSIGYRQNIGFGKKILGFSIAGVVRDAATTEQPVFNFSVIAGVNS